MQVQQLPKCAPSSASWTCVKQCVKQCLLSCRQHTLHDLSHSTFHACRALYIAACAVIGREQLHVTHLIACHQRSSVSLSFQGCSSTQSTQHQPCCPVNVILLPTSAGRPQCSHSSICLLMTCNSQSLCHHRHKTMRLRLS